MIQRGGRSERAASGQSCSPCPQAPFPPPLEQVGIHLAAQLCVGGCCAYTFPLGIINQGQHCWILGWETVKENPSTAESGAGNSVRGKPSLRQR